MTDQPTWEPLDPPQSPSPEHVAHEKVQRRLAEMIDFLDVADQIVAKGETSFLDPSNRIDELAAAQTLTNLHTAANHITRESPDFQERHPELPWRELASTRHRFAHHDGGIRRLVLFETLRTDLPGLRRLVTALIDP